MAHRKLQQEVDRVFKKISEGIDSFNDSYERHEMSNNQTQRDKLENDLKKEIKKLQRLREQIKVWQTQNEVKDKDALLRFRKLVESAMEKYKQVEKDSKHKAFSKEGLTQPEQLSPEEREKQDSIEYIRNVLEQLQLQTEGIEAESAKLTSSRRSKKGGLGPKEQEWKAELDEILDMFKFHQQNLELVLRLLQNGKLEPSLLESVKEDIQYFLESNREPDFMFDDAVYEPLELKDRDTVLVHDVKVSFEPSADSVDEDEESQPEQKKKSTPVPTSPVPSAAATAATAATSSTASAVESSHSRTHSGHSNHSKSGTSKQILVNAATLTTTTSSLKPATKPIRPAGDLKWTDAASAGTSSASAGSHVNSANGHASSPASSGAPLSGVSTSSPVGNDKSDKSETPSASAHLAAPSAPAVEASPRKISKLEQEFDQDMQVALLPTGLQSFLGSYVQAKDSGAANVGIKEFYSSLRDMSSYKSKLGLSLAEIAKLNLEWDVLRQRFQYDSTSGTIVNLEAELANAKVALLFFGYYYANCSAERQIAKRGLYAKSWRMHVNNVHWFFKSSASVPTATATAGSSKFDTGNYEIFDASTWLVKVLNEYQLDTTQLQPLMY